MKLSFAALLFAATSLLALPAAAQQIATCSFHDYTIPNAGFTNLNQMNNLGHFVGTYSYNGQYRSFLYAGSRHDIAVKNAFQTEARGLNNHDTIAGDFYDSTVQRQRGFLLNGRYLTVLDYPGAQATIVSGLNDSSVAVGMYTDHYGEHGFVHHGNTYVAIDYPHASSTWAMGINNNGQIAGVYQDQSGINHGFLYQNGKFSSLNFPGADNTSALGIGPNGTVIGNYYQGGQGHGFMYAHGVYKNATFPGGSQSTIPVGYNVSRTLTGGYVDAAGREHGFIGRNCW